MGRFALLLLTLLVSWGASHAQGSFYRSAAGKWLPLPTSPAGKQLKFTLAPEQVGAGGTVVVVDKPKWMVLDDEQPPRVAKMLLDGREIKAEGLAVGRVKTAPQEFVCALEDDKNPLDLKALRVYLDGAAAPAERLSVKSLRPDSKAVRVAVKLAGLPPAAHTVRITVPDRSPAHNLLSLELSYSTAPLLPNGNFEAVMPDKKPVDWQCSAWSATAQTQYEIDVREGGIGGGKALRLKGIAGELNLVCFQDRQDLRPGNYVLRGHYKTGGGAALSLYTYVGEKQTTTGQSLTPAADWTPFTWEFTIPECDHLLLVVRVSGPQETWFDELVLEEK